MTNKKRAILFSLYILPFLLNIALIDFIIPVKYDSILDNLPLFGLLITIAWLASTFLDFFVGDVTDRIGVKKTIQIGVLFCFIGSLLFGLSQNIFIMTFGVFLWGFAYILLTIPSDTYVLSSFPPHYRGSAYGIMYFFHDLSFALAPLIGLAIIYFFGIDKTIIISAILVLFSFLFLFSMREKTKENIVKGIENAAYKDGFILKELKDIVRLNFREISLLLNMFICALGYMTIFIASPLLFFHADGNLFNGALLTCSFMLPFVLTDYIYGKIADSDRKRKVMIKFGFFMSFLILSLFYFVNNFVLLLFLAFAFTFMLNLSWVGTEVELSQYLPKGKKGEYMGIFTTAKDLGFDLAPLCYGLIASISLKLPFLFLAILLFLALLLFIFANRENRI